MRTTLIFPKLLKTMTTLSSAGKEQGYSTPGIPMPAGPRGAAVPIHRKDQKPQKNQGHSGQGKIQIIISKSAVL